MQVSSQFTDEVPDGGDLFLGGWSDGSHCCTRVSERDVFRKTLLAQLEMFLYLEVEGLGGGVLDDSVLGRTEGPSARHRVGRLRRYNYYYYKNTL